MRKTSIALLVAVVSSPLALAYDYDKKYGSGDYHRDADKNITVDVDKTKEITNSYNEDNDYLKIEDVNNKDIYKFTDNSVYDNSQDIVKDIENNYYTASSYLDGMVTYSEVTYGGACCKGGYHNGYGDPDPAMLTVTQTNTMSNAFSDASGINIAGQNAGNNSLVQQSASTNAMLTGN